MQKLKENDNENIKQLKPNFILVSCCTFERPNMLALALMHLRKIILPTDIRVELLIVDNSNTHPVEDIVNNFRKNFPIKINYVKEPQRGIAHARNRVLKEAIDLGASHIALFDDDGLVDKNWLINHIEAYQNSKAQIISGPQYTWFNDDYPKYIMNNNIFKVNSTKGKGAVLSACATNNVFFPTNIYKENNIYFDEMYVFMGGEDGDFFRRLSDLGYKIIFNPQAIVHEITDESRSNVQWIIKRSYYNGYSGALLKLKYSKGCLFKLLYIAKLLVVILFDLLIIPLSLLRGLTFFFNAVCITVKNIGKLMGCIRQKIINYYAQ